MAQQRHLSRLSAIGTILLLVISAFPALIMLPPTSHAHNGVSLSAFASAIPAIDGVLSPGEWSDASKTSFPLHAHATTLYEKNDGTFLYLAVVVHDDYKSWCLTLSCSSSPSPSSPSCCDQQGDALDFFFDNTHDGNIYMQSQLGDDAVLFKVGLPTQDAFTRTSPGGGISWQDDVSYGGTNDVVAAYSHTNPVPGGLGDYTFELRKTLSSGDIGHDFSRRARGSTLGVFLEYVDTQLGANHGFQAYWPGPVSCYSLNPATPCVGADIKIASATSTRGIISLSPSSGSTGASVTITGTDLNASHALVITYDGSATGMPTSCSTNATGGINPGCIFTVPSSLPGQYAVTVTDGTNSPTATFTVSAHSISLSPSSGAVGTSVIITGAGFLTSHSLMVKYDSSTTGMPATCSTDSSGDVNSGCTFTVPFSAAGRHTVGVGDGTNSLTATFTVPLLVRCSKSTVVVGSATTCKATVGGSGSVPFGTVAWSSNSSGEFSKTYCVLSPRVLFSTCSVRFTPTAAGSSVMLTANYGGDAWHLQSAGTYSLTVLTKPTRTTLTCNPKSTVAGSPTIITCKAKVIGYLSTGTVRWSQSGTGSVSLSSTTCTLIGLSIHQAICSVTMTGATAGAVTLHATYSGDPNNLGSYRTAQLTIT